MKFISIRIWGQEQIHQSEMEGIQAMTVLKNIVYPLIMMFKKVVIG